MKSWFNWAFRRTPSQQLNAEEEYNLPVTPVSSVNTDQSSSERDREGEQGNTKIEALTPIDTEEGVVFAKNNVLLRVSDSSSSPRHRGNKKGEEYLGNDSGYFYMRVQELSFHGNTFIVHWLANSELKKAVVAEHNESAAASNNSNTVSIELNTLEMIRIFYDSDNDTPSSGQMVLYSRNGIFHIFKFVSGGLEKLTDLLKGCPFLRETNHQEIEQASHKQVTFIVYAPRLGLKELHPGEHEVQTQLNKETWDDLHDREGRITALKLIQKVHTLTPCVFINYFLFVHMFMCSKLPICV